MICAVYGIASVVETIDKYPPISVRDTSSNDPSSTSTRRRNFSSN